MALINCPECGKEISDKATACIHCGYPLQNSATVSEKQISEPDDLDAIANKADRLRLAKKYHEALALYKKAAALGHARSQTWIGNIYWRGLGVEKDYSQALHWFEMAAKQNRTSAISNLGMMYERGEGVTSDVEKAAELYLRASNMGDKDASHNLAALYDFGRGIAQNKSLAVKYYERAIEQGSTDPVVYNNLGVLYMDGKGTPKDWDKALKHLTFSAEKGHELGKRNLHILKTNIQANQTIIANDNPQQASKEVTAEMKLSNAKPVISKLMWTVIIDIIIIAVVCWFMAAGLHFLNTISFFAITFVVALISWYVYTMYISDNAPTEEEKKEMLEREKYNNFRYTCPYCKSKKVKSIGTFNRALSIHLWGLASSKIGKDFECDNCKRKW